MNMNKYQTYTAAKLIEIYCEEHKRINREDAEITQCLVKWELRRRFETMLDLMDCKELADKPEGFWKYFTREYTEC